MIPTEEIATFIKRLSEIKTGNYPEFISKTRDVFVSYHARSFNMVIDMSSFGEMLMSRPAGREAIMGASAYIFDGIKADEVIGLDFSNVKMLAPSWADEFITGLKSKLTNKIDYLNTENPSVKASLKTVLEPIDVTKYQKV